MTPSPVPYGIPNLFRHYKGGFSRRLFDATVYRESDPRDVLLFEARHADDERIVRVMVGYPSSSMRARDDSTMRIIVVDPDKPVVGAVDTVVVYLSLTYGGVWVRTRREFFGPVQVPGADAVTRFVPIRSTV